MADVYALENEAEKLKDAGDYEAAIAKLKEALAQDESFVRAHLALAVLLGKVDEHEQAVKHAQRACELEPTDSFNFTALSVTYQRAWAGTQNQQYIHLAEEAMARAHMAGGR